MVILVVVVVVAVLFYIEYMDIERERERANGWNKLLRMVSVVDGNRCVVIACHRIQDSLHGNRFICPFVLFYVQHEIVSTASSIYDCFPCIECVEWWNYEVIDYNL